MATSIGGIGDLTVDIILPGLSRIPGWGQEIEIKEPKIRLGGNIGNMAVGASALNSDFKIFSTVGDDEEGDFILSQLKKMGLSINQIKKTSRFKTSRTFACIRNDGERFMLTYKGTLKLIETTMIENENLPVDVIFLGGWCLPPRISTENLIKSIDKWHSQNRIVATDLLWSDETWKEKNKLISVLNKIDILFLNEAELLMMTEREDLMASLERLAELIGFNKNRKQRMCAVKLGKNGSALIFEDGVFIVDAYPVEPIDTVGAGDLFNIAFLHALFQMELSPPAALEFATTFASIYISRYFSSPPGEEEIIKSMQNKVRKVNESYY
jgi:ribokinase